jgi:hypothetical protein
MKRDAIPTPGPAAQPEPVAPHRTSRVLLESALLALQMREYTIAALQLHLSEKHPDLHLDMERLIERLVQRGEIEFVGPDIGLTEDGEDAAARIRERPAARISQTVSTEAQRRIQALASLLIDPTLLTLGQPRAAASAADLAPPPIRPGAEACLELPSRIGQELHYRDGRITRMDGTEIQPAHVDSDYVYRPTRDGRNPDQRMGWRESQATW